MDSLVITSLGEESWSIINLCFSCICLFILHALLSVCLFVLWFTVMSQSSPGLSLEGDL